MASYRGTTVQQSVLNDVMFQATDVEVALNQQVQHATKVATQLEKRLFALQAEQQQCRDALRSASASLGEIERSRDMTPRSSTRPSPRRQVTTPMTDPNSAAGELNAAIDVLQGAVSMLSTLADEMQSLEGRLAISIQWLRDLISRDSDCLTSVGCRKQRAKEYRRSGAVQLSTDMSSTEWPSQANAVFVESGDVMKRSADARRSAFDVCRHAQLMAARTKKASMDSLAEAVSSRLEQRHTLQCQLESIAKKRYDTDKTLQATKGQLDTLRDPLKVALARQTARHEVDDTVGRALKAEKATVVRGYRQLRHLTKQLSADLASADSEEDAVKVELEQLERDLASDRDAMMSENALRVTLVPQPPQKSHMRTYAAQRVQAANPIVWEGPGASPVKELRFSLWNNLCVRQYAGSPRKTQSPADIRDHERKRRENSIRSPRGGAKRPQTVPHPPPKTARR